MEEKIKIYISDAINNILLKDMELFEFYKKDGSFNKNEFYNTLIIHYYQQYQQKQEMLFDNIKKTIAHKFQADETTMNDITSQILEYVDNQNINLNQQKTNIVLSMKPTKKSSDVINFIEDYCLNNATVSSYFRNMFASYSLLPQDKREKIIFSDHFRIIEKAIKENKKLYFATLKNPKPHIVSPYSICNSKEELFNYLIAYYNNKPYSFRISRLTKLNIINESREFSDLDLQIFKKMEEQGPQYNYELSKLNQQIKVKLTSQGKDMYKSFYIHRPKISKIENEYYYFDCSMQQAYQYFSRFGRHAIILEPKSLNRDLHQFYIMASNDYYKALQKE